MIQVRCDLHLNHYPTHLSCSEIGHMLNMLLFNVTGGKQKDQVLLDFQENKDLFRKMFILSVGRCGQKYLCKVDFINKKVIELIFKLSIPFVLSLRARLHIHSTVWHHHVGFDLFVFFL